MTAVEALAVPCPVCGSAPDERCRVSDGGGLERPWPHDARSAYAELRRAGLVDADSQEAGG